MALFQDTPTTEEEFNKLHNQNQKPDIFTQLGYDDILKEREQKRLKQVENEKLWVSNLISPEKVKEWENKGPMTAVEVWRRKNKNELTPYMSTIQQGSKSIKLKEISDKLRNGQFVRPDEREMFSNFVLDMAEIQTRGYSFGGGAVNIGLETIPFMAEFGVGLLTSGGTASFGSASSKLTAKFLEKGLKQQIAEGVKKTLYNATLNPKTYAFTATRLPQQVRARMGDIMLSDSIAITPEGQAILQESETKPAIAFMKALALTNIETASEMSGDILIRPFMRAGGKLGKIFASPITKRLPAEFKDKFIKLAEEVTNMPFLKAVDTLGWNGVLEEIGEERVGDLLQFAFNLDDKEGYTFEQLLDAMFPNISQGFEEYAQTLGQEAVSFGFTGVGMNAMHKGISSLPVAGEKYTKDGFLVDAGIFRVGGYDSYLDKQVKEQLKNMGKSDDEIDNAVQFSTRDDKVQFLKDSKVAFDTKKEFDTKEQQKREETKKKRLEVEDNVYQKFVAAGENESVALSNAQLVGQFFEDKINSDKEETRKKAQELLDNLEVRYNVPVEEQNKKQFQSVADAGANKNDFADAQKEWKEKGTESKYFKKWFGESKVVDENGNPLVVYHGSPESNIKIFDSNKSLYGDVSTGFTFFTNKKSAYQNSAKDYADFAGTNGYNRHGKVYESYLSIKKPLHIQYTSNSMSVYNGEKRYSTPVEYYDSNYKKIKEEYKKGNYDGIIIENTDKNDDDSIIYLVPNSEQIKSVDNQGTFDEKNPNIYFQEEKEIELTDDDKNAINDFRNFVEKVLKDKTHKNLSKQEKSAPVTFGKTPQILVDAGISNNNIAIGYGVINKAQSNTNPDHNLSKPVIKNVLESLHKPIAIVKDKAQLNEKTNKKSNNRYGIIIDLKNDKENYILVSIETDKNIGSGNIINDIRTIHSRNSFMSMIKNAVEEDRLIKIKKSKLKDLLLGKQSDSISEGGQTSLIDIINQKYANSNVLFQNDHKSEPDEKLIAGSTYEDIMLKMTDLWQDYENAPDKATEEDIIAKIHILENAFEYDINPEKYSQELVTENALNVYYIMNNIEMPKETVEAELKSPRTYKDLLKSHKEKLEKQESEYYGYYKKENGKDIITIMSNSNPSTALHELGHFFLNSLNELAKIDEDAKKQLEAVDKWLGRNGEYTRQQHEKFARSFEAYCYKGKAPNNTLRKVFENFKNWLRSVYSSVSELQSKGAEISPEVEELFDRIFNNDQNYEERKQINAFLKKVRKDERREKINNYTPFDDSGLDEVQKRHKEVSYAILSKATGKSVKYLKTLFESKSDKSSMIKKREQIENLLDKTDDKIYVSGGFMPEWSEFYSDPGVSYENAESGADEELAYQAFDTILNHAYTNPEKALTDELSQRGEYFEKEIEHAQEQYKLLMKEFKNGNRNIALAAIYEWLNGLHQEIREDYETKFSYDAALIERNENFDKFDKAKHEIIKKAVELENGSFLNKNEKFKELVKEIMKNLDFLQPSDKAKMTVNILDVPDSNFLAGKIDSIMDIAKTMEDVRYRNQLAWDIHKELQQTKNIKKNGRTVGKYDYKRNKIFEKLRELDRLSPEQANELRLEQSLNTDAEDNGLTPDKKLYNKFLSYKANGRTFADTELIKDIYDEILKLKLIGKTAKSELELNEKFNEESDVEELIQIVQNKKESSFGVKTYINMLGNLESTLNAIFNKDIKERYGAEILYAETRAQAWQYEQKQKFEKGVADIYNLPEWNWDKKVLQYLGEKHTFPEKRRKYDVEGNVIKERIVDRTLTKMDIIQAYIWDKNPVLSKRLENQFGEETVTSMFDLLSEQDKQFAQLMMQTAQSFYPMVNRGFIQKYGLDLPKVSCYFPSTPERTSEVDLYNEYSTKSLNNSFTKSRSQSETQPMDFHNPVATLYSHIEGVAKFSFMSESLDRANIRFKNNDLKRVIINKYGEDAYRTLDQILANVTYKNEAPVFNGVNKIIDNMVGNWIQANVAVKPIVGLKQLLSANNYAVDMPYMTWQMGFLKALANPKATIDYMMNIPYIKARFGGSYTNEFLKQTVENSKFAASKKLKDLCNIFIKTGDIGAIIFGGKPYVDYLIKEKGMSEEEAIKQFIISTNRSQQSSAVSSLSNFQVNMTRNPVGKLFIAFKNSPQQYIRMCGDAVVSTINGDMTKSQCAKMLFQFGYLQPFLYAAATSGAFFRFIVSGDDDDLLKDAKISIFNFGSDALPIIGDIYKYALNRIGYKEKYLPQTTPLLGDIENEINRISKEDVSAQDYMESIGYMLFHIGLGYNSKAIMNEGSGALDIVKGDIAKGSMKVLGYTEKRAEHISKKE